MSLLTIVAQVLLGATLPNSPGGYFYGLTDPSGFYFLVRMDAEGNVDRLGERGSVGLPPVGGLAWDNYRNRLVGWRLLGNANQTVQWIEFDVATGAPRILSSSSFPTGLEGFTHGHPQSAAFHPKTGMLYAIVEQVGIMKIDIDTGESHPVNAGFEYNRITWVDGFLGEFTGFIAATRNNPKLVYFDTASWNSVPIGGLPESQNVRVSFWDDSQHTLFGRGSH